MATSSPTVAPGAARSRAAQRAAPIIVPRVDIYETPDRFVLLADMPGVAPDGLEVVAERDSLIVHGRVVPPDVVPEYGEFELGDYHRVFTLTEDLDTDDILATLHDGVLRIEIKKSQRVQPRKIPVRAE
jgi:HSP20 family molecular chaperone IbpA